MSPDTCNVNNAGRPPDPSFYPGNFARPDARGIARRRRHLYPWPMRILAIESSCDETAAAVIDDGRVVRSSVVASQVNLHAQYGGIVPEVASRQHLVAIGPVAREALTSAGCTLDEIEMVAATRGPGLAGALLVGAGVACSLAARPAHRSSTSLAITRRITASTTRR